MRRLRAGEWLAGIGGLVLIVSLFLPWYGDATGFESLSIIDILLVLVAVLALALPVLQVTQDSPSRPVAAGVLSVVLGFIAVLLVLFRVIDTPGDGGAVQPAVWIALAATAAIAGGGWLSIANESPKGLPPGPEPELRPAP